MDIFHNSYQINIYQMTKYILQKNGFYLLLKIIVVRKQHIIKYIANQELRLKNLF